MNVSIYRDRMRPRFCWMGTVALLLSFNIETTHSAEVGHELGRVKIKPLRETSGIAASRQNGGIVWLHNDGEATHIYAVSMTGRPAAQVRLPGGIEDLEDIAIAAGGEGGGDQLYLGDIGDNDGDRREVRVYALSEPKLGTRGELIAEDVRVFRLSYPDGSHDAEALLVDPDTGDLIIATKEDDRTRIYLVEADQLRDGSGAELRYAAELEVGQVSGGDISRDGRLLLLRSERHGWLWKRAPGQSWEAALASSPEEVPVRGSRQGENGEAVGFAADGASYLTISEGKGERLYSFPLSAVD
jgi:hypothetical protein